MTTRSDSLVRLLAALTVVGAAMLALSPVAAGTDIVRIAATPDAPLFGAPLLGAPGGWQPDPDPEEDLTVAEFGIDPMVTGPVSEEFRQRQASLRCHEATWPNIPAACYPNSN